MERVHTLVVQLIVVHHQLPHERGVKCWRHSAPAKKARLTRWHRRLVPVGHLLVHAQVCPQCRAGANSDHVTERRRVVPAVVCGII